MQLSSATQWQAALVRQTETLLERRLPSGVALRAFAHQPFRSDHAAGCRDHLVACRLSGTAHADRTMAGRRRQATTRAGMVTIIPAGQPTSWFIDGRGSMLHVFIPPGYLDDVAQALETPPPMGDITDCLGAGDPPIAGLAAQLTDELERGLPGCELFAETVTLQLVIHLIRRYTGQQRGPTPDRGRLGEAARARLVAFVEAELDRSLSLSELAAVVGLHASWFSRRFKATFGCTPYSYVLQRRVARAATLLRETDLPLAEVGLTAGFCSQSQLTSTFKRLHGVTPGLYRAELRG